MAFLVETPPEIPGGDTSGSGQGFAQQSAEDTRNVVVVFSIDAMIPGVTLESKGIFPLGIGASITTLPVSGITAIYFVHLQIKDKLSKKYLPVLVTLNSVDILPQCGELLFTVPEPAATPLLAVKVTGHAVRAVDVTYHIVGN